MSEFIVSGRFEARDGPRQFETTFVALDEDVAVDRTSSGVGCRPGLERSRAGIDAVTEAEVSAT